MKKFKDLFCEIVTRSGLSPAEISRRTQRTGQRVAESSISSAMNGKRALSIDLINALSKVIHMTEIEKEELILLAFAFREEGAAQVAIVGMIEKLKESSNGAPINAPARTKGEVPVWSKVKAGASELTDETAETWSVTKMDEEEIRAGCFCMLISGESMEGERIFDGDYAHFQPWNYSNVTDHDVYAVEVEGWPLWMIKKIRQLPGGKIRLLSAHPNHAPIEIDPAVTRISVKGRLLRIVRERGKSFAVS